MKVEIWSDVMCPFCYIGKRNFEAALEQFEHKEKVEVIWRSFQLDPSMQYEPDADIYTYLAERKGWTREQSIEIHTRVTERAREAGLTYNFDKAVINNSFDAHRFLQFAKQHGKGDAAEEQLFQAYFTDGKNIGDAETLAGLGAAIGLDPEAIRTMLQSNALGDAVRSDITEAEILGIRAVPFFVFDRKYAVSGAQPVAAFQQSLERAFLL